MIGNAEMLVLPPGAKLVADAEARRLEQRRQLVLTELDARGWAPPEGWLSPPRKCSECGKPHRVPESGQNVCMPCWRRLYEESDL